MIAKDKRSSLFCIKIREKGLKNGTIFNEGLWAASFCHQVSISPTFYEQLCTQNLSPK